MAKKLPSGRWREQVYLGKDESGKKIVVSITADTKKEAEFLAAQRKVEKRAIVLNKTVGDVADEYIASREGIVSINYIKQLQYGREHYFQSLFSMRPDDLTKTVVQKAIDDEFRKNPELSEKTLKKVYTLIKVAIDETERTFPVKFRKKQKEAYRVPTADELKAVLDFAKGKDIYLPILLAARHSLRRGEVLGLRYSDFNFDSCSFTVRRSMEFHAGGKSLKSPKTEAGYRKIKSNAYICGLVRERQKQYGADDDDLVFRFSENWMYRHLHCACRDIGIEPFAFHALRHFHRSAAAMAGIPDYQTMKDGGWSGIQVMNSHYLDMNIFEKSDIEAAEKMDDFFEKMMG